MYIILSENLVMKERSWVGSYLEMGKKDQRRFFLCKLEEIMIQKSKEWGAEVEENILNENREGCPLYLLVLKIY